MEEFTLLKKTLSQIEMPPDRLTQALRPLLEAGLRGHLYFSNTKMDLFTMGQVLINNEEDVSGSMEFRKRLKIRTL
jgi:hypothetical protein